LEEVRDLSQDRQTDIQNDDDCSKTHDYSDMFSGVLAYDHFVICMAKRKPNDRKVDSSNAFRLICRKRTDYLTNMSHASMGTYRSHT